MAHENLTPARRMAIGFIQALADAHAADEKFRFPSIKKMASAAGVSFKTMWKAAAELAKSGVIESYPRQGIFLRTASAGSAAARAAEKMTGDTSGRGVWKRATQRIGADIIKGAYEPGALLPGYKELQRIYGVSFATLKKCLDSLHREGVIMPHGAHYVVTPLVVRASSVKIVLIHAVDWYWQRKGMGFWEEGFYELFLRNLEEMCARSSIAIDVVFRASENGRSAYYNRATNQKYAFEHDDTIMGYICEVKLLDAHELEQEISRLVSTGKPVAVFNPGDNFRLPAGAASNRMMRIFRTSSDQECGRDMARYLLSLGHKKIAFISPHHAFDWSQQRLDGLAQTYTSAGFPDAITKFTLDEFGRRWSFYDAVPTDHKPDAWLHAYRAWEKAVCSQYAATIGPIISYAAYDCIIKGEIYRRLAPLFEQAFQDASITAWVCANDFAGILAMDYLARNGKSVPQNISVAGFDDSRNALTSGLTTYNFDIPALVSTMLRFVMQTDQIARFHRSRIVRIPGHIVARSSVVSIK